MSNMRRSTSYPSTVDFNRRTHLERTADIVGHGCKRLRRRCYNVLRSAKLLARQQRERNKLARALTQVKRGRSFISRPLTVDSALVEYLRTHETFEPMTSPPVPPRWTTMPIPMEPVVALAEAEAVTKKPAPYPRGSRFMQHLERESILPPPALPGPVKALELRGAKVIRPELPARVDMPLPYPPGEAMLLLEPPPTPAPTSVTPETGVLVRRRDPPPSLTVGDAALFDEPHAQHRRWPSSAGHSPRARPLVHPSSLTHALAIGGIDEGPPPSTPAAALERRVRAVSSRSRRRAIAAHDPWRGDGFAGASALCP